MTTPIQNTPSTEPLPEVSDWWTTAISRIRPGEILLRGYPVEQLIGQASFPDMIWLMVRGDLPTRSQSQLLEAALVSSVDHGPQAPSIAASRMAATCGLGLNNVMATGVSLLGDTHGGAGQQCMQLLDDLIQQVGDDGDLDEAAEDIVATHRAQRRHIPGFGHRFHPHDPRRNPLLDLVADASTSGAVPGRALAAGTALERALAKGAADPSP